MGRRRASEARRSEERLLPRGAALALPRQRLELAAEARRQLGTALDQVGGLGRVELAAAEPLGGLLELLDELLHRDDVPAEVAIDEAVESAKEFASADAPGFVNGILGAVQRQEVPAP